MPNLFAYAMVINMKVWRKLICLALAITILFSCVLNTTVTAYTQQDLNDVNNKLIPSFQNERNQEKTNSIQRNTIQNSFDESLRVNLEEINI